MSAGEPIARSGPESVEHTRASGGARNGFGGEFVEQYAAYRPWEVEKYRLAVSDWERRRYFAMV